MGNFISNNFKVEQEPKIDTVEPKIDTVEPKIDTVEPKIDSVKKDIYNDNSSVLEDIQHYIEQIKTVTGTIIPFPLEPSIDKKWNHITPDRIDSFINDKHMRLKFIGESSGFIPKQYWIYRHHDGDIFTFWRKDGDNLAIKPYSPSHDLIAPNFFENIVLPPGAGICEDDDMYPLN